MLSAVEKMANEARATSGILKRCPKPFPFLFPSFESTGVGMTKNVKTEVRISKIPIEANGSGKPPSYAQ